ncbi:prepilin peptidase [Enterobacter sp. MW07]|nr:prepilin peptidase [Enterobacter sp. MW07]
MRTIIVTGFSTLWCLPLLLGFALFGRGLMWRVSDFLRQNALAGQPLTQSAGIWLFALFSMSATLAPAPVTERAGAVVMMAFLLQAGITDAVSGYLPRTFTLRLLVSGLLWQLLLEDLSDGLAMQLMVVALMAGLMLGLNMLANRGVQRLGHGDLWLITGLTAWMGMKDAAIATLCGAAAFVLWLLTWHLSGKKEGPLGPWLCLSGSVLQLSHLYQPLWITIL